MSQSPGHAKWPQHKVEKHPLGQRAQVRVKGVVVADSRDVIVVEEDKHPTRWYFPRQDVRVEALERTDKTTECPFKGLAHYYNLNVDGETVQNGAWSYEDPYDEHRDLTARVAFHADQMAEIEVAPIG